MITRFREVRPDERIDHVTDGPDPQVERAIEWLLDAPGCEGSDGLRPERRMP